nr:Putative uncharacterized protein [Moritella viscosa]SHO10692.1 Putative uncharacterized protein [Moritella viscosa]SHO15836.1 Putative uncharacterized protein [Moritella viscosa]
MTRIQLLAQHTNSEEQIDCIFLIGSNLMGLKIMMGVAQNNKFITQKVKAKQPRINDIIFPTQ